MTVSRLLEEMDSEELLAWSTLAEIEADEADRAEQGKPPAGRPSRRKLVTDPTEIRAWFASNR